VKIAVFRVCGVGDAVQLTPLLQQIRHDFPEAEIFFFVNQSVAPLFAGCPYVTDTISLPEAWVGTEAERFGLWNAWGEVARRGPFDYLFFFDPRIRRGLGSFRVKAARKTGLLKSAYRWLSLYTDPIYYDLDPQMDGRKIHASAIYLNAWTRTTGRADGGYGYNLRYLTAQPFSFPADIPERYVVFAPGAGNPLSPGRIKRWPIDHWLALEALLIEMGHEVVWLGSHLDAAEIPIPASPRNLMGKMSLLEAVGIISRGMGLVANDSGLFHVALGLGKKTVGFYGPTGVEHVGPFRTDLALVYTHQLPCVPCWKGICDWQDPALAQEKRPYCLSLVRPEKIAKEILAFIEP
jgi:heptosyltransferase-2